MVSLYEKIISCYKKYLLNLTYGITDQDYCDLYGAVLLTKNDIEDKKYVECFKAKLMCKKTITLIPAENRVISWTLSSNPYVTSSFSWTEILAPQLKVYEIETPALVGYNFIYITIPDGSKAKIYDELNNLLLDTGISGSWEFSNKGTITTSKQNTNIVFRKNNVFNTIHPVKFYIKLY